MPVISGINPCIFLYLGGKMTFALSYWQIDVSPHGAGTCVFRADHHSAQVPICATDNLDLAKYLHENFNRHFDGFKEPEEIDFVESNEPLVRAEFRDDGASLSVGEIEANWHRTGSPSQIIDTLDGFGQSGDQSYHVSAVIVPCESATISVSGKRVPGLVANQYGELPSSAFLAVGESWRLM